MTLLRSAASRVEAPSTSRVEAEVLCSIPSREVAVCALIVVASASPSLASALVLGVHGFLGALGHVRCRGGQAGDGAVEGIDHGCCALGCLIGYHPDLAVDEIGDLRGPNFAVVSAQRVLDACLEVVLLLLEGQKLLRPSRRGSSVRSLPAP